VTSEVTTCASTSTPRLGTDIPPTTRRHRPRSRGRDRRFSKVLEAGRLDSKAPRIRGPGAGRPTLAAHVGRVATMARVRGEGGEGRQAKLDTRQIQGGEGGEVVALWVGKGEALERLGVSERTLQRLVRRGEVVRRQVGREARYRVATVATMPATPDTRHARHVGEGGEGPPEAPRLETSPGYRSFTEVSPKSPAADTSAGLAAVVERLAMQLAEARAEAAALACAPRERAGRPARDRRPGRGRARDRERRRSPPPLGARVPRGWRRRRSSLASISAGARPAPGRVGRRVGAGPVDLSRPGRRRRPQA
jgi:phage terminase Nu1 subunit (DNA packaging protein)